MAWTFPPNQRYRSDVQRAQNTPARTHRPLSRGRLRAPLCRRARNKAIPAIGDADAPVRQARGPDSAQRAAAILATSSSAISGISERHGSWPVAPETGWGISGASGEPGSAAVRAGDGRIPRSGRTPAAAAPDRSGTTGWREHGCTRRPEQRRGGTEEYHGAIREEFDSGNQDRRPRVRRGLHAPPSCDWYLRCRRGLLAETRPRRESLLRRALT